MVIFHSFLYVYQRVVVWVMIGFPFFLVFIPHSNAGCKHLPEVLFLGLRQVCRFKTFGA